MYHGLSGEGAIRKRFFSHRTVHRGRFLFEKRFEEVAFSSEVALKRTASTAERQLTCPEGGPKDNETYAEDVRSGEDDIDTEDGSGEHGFNREGDGGEGGIDTRRAVVERTVQELAYILQVHKRNE